MILVSLTAGCSQGNADDPQAKASKVPAPVLADVLPPAPDQPNDALLPLAAYQQLSATDLALVARADALLTRSCMADLGFDYQAEPNTGSRPEDTPQIPAYGINDPAAAKEFGYGTDDGMGGPGRLVSGEELSKLAEEAGLPSENDLIEAHGKAWVEALMGTPDGSKPGCMQASKVIYDKAYGDLDRDLSGKLKAEALNLTKLHPRVVAATESWSACMKAAGFNYRTPQEPMTKQWPPGLSNEERDTAVADVACKRKSKIADVWLAVEKGYQESLIEQHADELAALNKASAALATAAQEVIAGD